MYIDCCATQHSARDCSPVDRLPEHFLIISINSRYPVYNQLALCNWKWMWRAHVCVYSYICLQCREMEIYISIIRCRSRKTCESRARIWKGVAAARRERAQRFASYTLALGCVVAFEENALRVHYVSVQLKTGSRNAVSMRPRRVLRVALMMGSAVIAEDMQVDPSYLCLA